MVLGLSEEKDLKDVLEKDREEREECLEGDVRE